MTPAEQKTHIIAQLRRTRPPSAREALIARVALLEQLHVASIGLLMRVPDAATFAHIAEVRKAVRS